jgi:four helix bundle protein
MASGVKDLKVWQEAVVLAGDVLRTLRPSIRRETKTFADLLVQSAVAVATSVAHGYASFGAEEQRLAYQEARRALLELETRLTVARHAGIIQPPVLAQLTGRVSTVSRLLSGYVAYLDRQAAAGTGLTLATTPPIRVVLADQRDGNEAEL